MKKVVDIGSKRLISLAPNNWVQWVTQRSDILVKEFLSSEFQLIERKSDVLLKVYSPEQGEFIILNELQLRYSAKMPQRIRAYVALAEERYDLLVYPVLINILPRSATQVIPSNYQSELIGIKAYQDYRVINLWEVDASLVFEENLSTLLPFVPVLKGGGEERVIREAVKKLRTNEQLSELEPLLSFFASFVLEIPLVREIMRWDMTVLRESPWYNELLKEGLEKGKQQGIEEGKQQGIQEGEATLILRLLTRRFGTIELSMEEQIRNLSLVRLEALGENLLDFSSLEDVLNWLNQGT